MTRKITIILFYVLTQCMVASTGQTPIDTYFSRNVPDTLRQKIDSLVRKEVASYIDSAFDERVVPLRFDEIHPPSGYGKPYMKIWYYRITRTDTLYNHFINIKL